jgi:hypothetical protein
LHIRLKSKNFKEGVHVKNIKELTTTDSKAKIRAYLNALKQKYNIFIMEGTLEALYKQKPRTTKEQGVLETLEKAMEENRPIDKFIDTTPLYDFLGNILEDNNLIPVKDDVPF